MRVLVATNGVPFIRGGAELLADALVRELNARGHQAEQLRIPLRWEDPAEVADVMLYARTVDLRDVDRVIALKFPAYLIPHPAVTVWLLHQFRQVYDLWGTPWGPDVADPRWQGLRHAIEHADTTALRRARRVFTNDTVTRDRLSRFNGVDATVLHPPLPDEGQIVGGPAGDYVLCLGRVATGKRPLLAVEAMARTRSDVRLVVAGQPESEETADALRAAVERHGLEDRVELRLRFLETAEKRELLAGALGVAYFPIDEDSFGYVTAEAMTASKPVVTVTDSGGILNLVRDGETGLVVDPAPEQVAGAFDRLAEDRPRSEGMGRAALGAVAELNLSWEHVIKELLR
ncbi:glycosyltransferase family 4 protein [Cellulomonas sp. PS-H5]|uniref:glycosyltransferase family 4 protein n=1 Tax=Cellulomonas sp. PS-H5 TaxID=2820400 RepID=UPI001C50152A|nr:glycosyltransferase family 4 protein [Cellulomonas sp. PS-H5]MBW0255532.1 glycosyltransferase family 4 protein [Cellulomonas sp. PS-H5]